MGVILKNHVLELTEIRFQKANGVCARKSDREVLDYPFCCLYSHICIYKSALMSHIDAMLADIKSRAPFSRHFETLKVKSPRSEKVYGTHKTETFPIPMVLYIRMSRKRAIFDSLSLKKEDMVDDFPVDDKDNIEEKESEVTVMEIDNFEMSI